jgi:hypothetical protein
MIRSQMAFALGACGGLARILMPAAVKTASKESVNWPARSLLRREPFDRLLIVNAHHLRQVLTEYLLHYNTARPHRAPDQLAPAQAGTRPPQINLAEYRICRKTGPRRAHARPELV